MTERRLRRRVRWLLTLAVLGALSLLACGVDEGRVRQAAETPVETFLSPSPDETTPLALTPTPTFRPLELAPTPADLDRQLADTEEMRAARQRLVQTRVVPVVTDETVLAAMLDVPRHAFVPTQYLDMAYNDHPLPIGYGQTISQPSLVAMMTAMLDLQAGDRVLEIGTGSGYQAAILRELTDQVYTIEIIPELAGTAGRIFAELGYGDIHVTRADGYYGWWEFAPFDAIIVTAAPDHLPAPLSAQLSPDGGRMVIPIGPPGGYQSLWLVQRHGDDISMERVLDVAFVPFTRE
jgi:protein-L-isoaspartate(D-aspartate) O-methyltransferase